MLRDILVAYLWVAVMRHMHRLAGQRNVVQYNKVMPAALALSRALDWPEWGPAMWGTEG